MPGITMFKVSMINTRSLIAGLTLSLLTSQSAFATDALWTTAAASKSSASTVKHLLELNPSLLQEVLANAPLKSSGLPGVKINVPLTNGETVELELFESPIMAPELAEKYPEIKTFKGFGESSVSARFDFTESGFRGVVFSDGETYYFDPASDAGAASETPLRYQRYARSEYVAQSDDENSTDSHAAKSSSNAFTCTVLDSQASDTASITSGDFDSGELRSALRTSVSGATLHTYRLAVAATGEYTQFHGGSVSSSLGAVVTAVNRINEIYERELSVRFTLVGNNDQLIFTNGSTDPYSNNDGFAMLSENTSTINATIGSGNYDIGHVFSTGGGGIAQLRAPCGIYKAEGVTGSPSPTNDSFWVDYVAHEIGHQMGANHTFNGTAGSCGGNRASSSAYEPGSASTIMGYAGICGSDNIAYNSDDYFHARSQEEIASFTSGSGNSCGTHNSTGNQVPVVDAGNEFTIPQQTPFVLTGSAIDNDGDSLTYNWEQYDLGASSAPGVDNGSGPIFRSFQALSTGVRTLPKMSTLINNTSPTLCSVLPSTSRVLDFRLTVRDGRGGVANDDTRIQVTANAGPFVITSPNSNLNWTGGTLQQVLWNVADTDQFPINCANVDILFSADNGQTFSNTLLSAAANDGSASVLVPNADVAQARIKVACSDNIFFDISDTALTVTEGLGQDTTNLTVAMVGTTGKWQDGKIHFDVTVTNADTNTAHNPVLLVTLPEDVEFGEYLSDTATCSLDQLILTCELPDLESEAESVVKVTVLTPKTLTKFDFIAEVSSDEVDVDEEDNSLTKKFGGALNVLLVGLLMLVALRRKNALNIKS